MTTYDFTEHTKGDTFYGVQFSLSNQDGPIDLTGVVIELTTDRAVGLSSEDEEIAVTNAAGGVFEISQQIIDWPIALYNYELSITYPTKVKRTYLKGTWNIV